MKTFGFTGSVLKGSVAALLLASGAASATELLNSSYDVSRELFAALNPPFQKQWADQNDGDKLDIKQSHAGSSKQALAILQGDLAGYLQAIAAAADAQYMKGAVCVVLAQASMTGAAQLTQMGKPLTSPECGLRAALA